MRMAASRSYAASVAPLGLWKAYDAGLLIDGTATSRDSSACGTSAPVFHACSGSTGAGIVSRYRPSQPGPCVDRGFAVDQMSVPSKCDRLEFS